MGSISCEVFFVFSKDKLEAWQEQRRESRREPGKTNVPGQGLKETRATTQSKGREDCDKSTVSKAQSVLHHGPFRAGLPSMDSGVCCLVRVADLIFRARSGPHGDEVGYSGV